MTKLHTLIWEELEVARARTTDLADQIRTGVAAEILHELSPEIALHVAKETAPVNAKLEQLIAETRAAGAKSRTG